MGIILSTLGVQSDYWAVPESPQISSGLLVRSVSCPVLSRCFSGFDESESMVDEPTSSSRGATLHLRSARQAVSQSVSDCLADYVLSGPYAESVERQYVSKEILRSEPSLIDGTLYLGRGLNLRFLGVSKLPEQLREVAGSINGFGSALQALPHGLEYVGGQLDLASSPLATLPPKLRAVGGNMYLGGVDQPSLPNSLEYVGGNLDLSGSAITTLPASLQWVGGDLNIRATDIATLPAGLVVGGALILDGRSRLQLDSNTVRGISEIRFINSTHIPSWLFQLEPAANNNRCRVVDLSRCHLSPSLRQSLTKWWTDSGHNDNGRLMLPTHAPTPRLRAKNFNSIVEFWGRPSNGNWTPRSGLLNGLESRLTAQQQRRLRDWIVDLTNSPEFANRATRQHFLVPAVASAFDQLVDGEEVHAERFFHTIVQYPSDPVRALQGFYSAQYRENALTPEEALAVDRNQLSVEFIKQAVSTLKPIPTRDNQFQGLGVDECELQMYALAALRKLLHLPIIDCALDWQAKPELINDAWLTHVRTELLEYHATLDKALNIALDGSSGKLPGGIRILVEYL